MPIVLREMTETEMWIHNALYLNMDWKNIALTISWHYWNVLKNISEIIMISTKVCTFFGKCAHFWTQFWRIIPEHLGFREYDYIHVMYFWNKSAVRLYFGVRQPSTGNLQLNAMWFSKNVHIFNEFPKPENVHIF